MIQSYRHRYGYAPGDPALAGIEAELARQPKIAVPTINLHGGHDGVGPVPDRDGQAKFFTGTYERRVLPRIGHNVPQEAPADNGRRPARPHERNQQVNIVLIGATGNIGSRILDEALRRGHTVTGHHARSAQGLGARRA